MTAQLRAGIVKVREQFALMGLLTDGISDEQIEDGIKATAQAFAAAGVTCEQAHDALIGFARAGIKLDTTSLQESC